MDDWKDSLPENLREAPYFKNAESVDQVLADLTNAAQWQGNSIRIPGPDATPEAISEYQTQVMEKIPGLSLVPDLENGEAMEAHFAKLGMPENADGYVTPDGLVMDANELGALKAIARKANMTQAQAATWLSELQSGRKEATDQAKLAFDESMSALKTELGAAFDAKREAALELLKSNSKTPAGIVEALESGELPADQLAFFMEVADVLDSKDMPNFTPEDKRRTEVVTPEEAEARIIEIEAGDAYWDASHPGHQVAKADHLRYMKMMNGLDPNAEIKGIVSA